jgi:hypothetical protein
MTFNGKRQKEPQEKDEQIDRYKTSHNFLYPDPGQKHYGQACHQSRCQDKESFGYDHKDGKQKNRDDLAPRIQSVQQGIVSFEPFLNHQKMLFPFFAICHI